ncbi:MAG TPA: hypothetical protein VJ890_16015 [Vineibacter sp.]|nr:hypothetical protein [Vineibacter sp.]
MLRVTVDLYSGKANPNWTVAGDVARGLLREAGLNRSAVAMPGNVPGRLGYRSMLVDVLDGRLSRDNGLPMRFALAYPGAPNFSKGMEIAEKLLATATTAALAGFLPLTPLLLPLLCRREIQEALRSLAKRLAKALAQPAPGSGITSCAFERLSFDPGFWNDPAHIAKNNCYAYATNKRTDTFPQPGLQAGSPITILNCADATRASRADGVRLVNDCLPDSEKPRLLVALVIWPGEDYHWYRLHSEGFWGHKPGETPAVNVDNAGNLITDPQTCDRGPYTDFCRFMLVPNSIVVR